jgi:hypothetical protein
VLVRPGPGGDPAVWQGIADFIHARQGADGGAMRAPYALLCVLYWLELEHGCPAASPADVKAILPRLGDVVAGPLRSPADALRRARGEGLVEALGDGRYRLTELGIAVVYVLPDAAQVGALRGGRRSLCRRRAVRPFDWTNPDMEDGGARDDAGPPHARPTSA